MLLRQCLSGFVIIIASSVGCSSSEAPASAPAEPVDGPLLSTRACVEGTINESSCTQCVDGKFRSYCEEGTVCKSGGECGSNGALGSACTFNASCASNFCVDGRCCSKSSCGGCGVCNSSGNCQPMAAGSSPKFCSLSTSGACGAKCDGSSTTCAFPSAATTCAVTTQCAGNLDAGYSYVTGTSACDGAGTCKPPVAGGVACGNYGCTTSSGCLTSCTTSAQCINSAFCVGGACKPKVGPGVECPASDACAATGSGTASCAPASDGKQRCCLVSCAAPKACSIDGTACVGTTPYGGACTSDDQCSTSKCAGGKCVNCKSDGDCSPADYCDGSTGRCNIRAGVGSTCTTAATCPSGTFCTDGVCCVSAACPDGTCAGAKKGACAKINGVACDKDSDCDSGKCVDGVCCDGACDGQCAACDVPGSLGKCVAVKGEPHGSRKSCASGDGTNPCSRAACDGDKQTHCAALAGSETSCRAASCLDGTATSAATCNGTGVCPDPVKAACGAYQCAPDQTCRTTCSVDADCAAGNICRDTHCEPRVAECRGPDTSVSRDGVEKACSPYRCDSSSGNCFTACTTSEQCGAGYLCADSKCSPVPAETSEDGGCSVGGPPRRDATSSGALVFVALAGAFGVARRSRRARR